MDEALCSNEVSIVFTGAGVVGARNGVTTRLRADIADWCREHIGPVEVVAAPSYGSATGFALRGSDADILVFKLRWR